jgi:hypothetical protein
MKKETASLFGGLGDAADFIRLEWPDQHGDNKCTIVVLPPKIKARSGRSGAGSRRGSQVPARA